MVTRYGSPPGPHRFGNGVQPRLLIQSFLEKPILEELMDLMLHSLFGINILSGSVSPPLW